LDCDTRLDFTKRCLKDFEKVEILEYEVNNQKPTPTIETIEYLKNKYHDIKKIYLIIGADNLEKLSSWYRYKDLNDNVEFVVASRNGINTCFYKSLDVKVDVSSSLIRDGIGIDYLPQEIKEEFKTLILNV
jgi:nicotinate-nucleotide adenylyltransferase